MSARRAIINDESSSLPMSASSLSQCSPAVSPKFVLPGARRSYWRMVCDVGSKKVRTKDIDTENKLELIPDTDNRTDVLNELFEFGDDYEEYSSEDFSSQAHPNDHKDKQYKSKVLKRVLGDSNFELSGEQKAVLNLVLNTKNNIFFTGAAGTGKSVLLKCIIALLRQQHGVKSVFVAAYTGIASCNIGGTTIHRWAGIGLGNKSVEELVKIINCNAKTKKRWKATKVLLIDEISMLSVSLLTKLEEIARIVRKNDSVFGGIQIICTGDLFQLPPIDRVDPRFCFESEVWDKIIHKTVNLTRVFRQSESNFAEVLNELRMGYVSEKADKLMSSLNRAPTLPKGLVPTKLFPTRSEVSRANSTSLARLGGTEYEYTCVDWKKDIPEAKFIDMSKYTIADEKIQLKIGAQVMLIKNIDSTLVNGSIGRVVAFMSHGGNYDDSMFGKDLLPEEIKDVAEFSRLMGVYGNSKSATRKRKLAEAMTAEMATSEGVFPVVKFVSANKTIRFLMVQPEIWEVNDFEGNVIASRTQIPLILAWALSIHKAQGQTLPYVSVDLKNVFEKGQSYVALSRATNLDGLQVLNFRPNVITASKVVKKFYEKLDTISSEEIKEAEIFFDQTFVEHQTDFVTEAEPMKSIADSEINSANIESFKVDDKVQPKHEVTTPVADKIPDRHIEIQTRKKRLASYLEKQADLLKQKAKIECEFRENQRLCEEEENIIAQYLTSRDENKLLNSGFAKPCQFQTISVDDADHAMFSDIENSQFIERVSQKLFSDVKNEHQTKKLGSRSMDHYM